MHSVLVSHSTEPVKKRAVRAAKIVKSLFSVTEGISKPSEYDDESDGEGDEELKLEKQTK